MTYHAKEISRADSSSAFFSASFKSGNPESVSLGWVKKRRLDEEGYSLNDFKLGQRQASDILSNFIGVMKSDAEILNEIANRENEFKSVKSKVEDRIDILRVDALDEKEVVDQKSEDDLRRFLEIYSFYKQPSIFLLENGNFRAVWKNEVGEQVGLQFLGDGLIQFVFFAKRTDSKLMSRSAGRDSFVGIHEQLQTFNLKGLVRA